MDSDLAQFFFFESPPLRDYSEPPVLHNLATPTWGNIQLANNTDLVFFKTLTISV